MSHSWDKESTHCGRCEQLGVFPGCWKNGG